MALFSKARRSIHSILAAALTLASVAAYAQTPGPPFVNLVVSPSAMAFGGGNYAILDIFIGIPSNAGFSNGTLAFTYPAGIVNSAQATPSNGCGGTLIADPGTNTVQITAMSNASGGCSIDIAVEPTAAGTYDFIFPAGGFTETPDGANVVPSATATLVVTAPAIVTNVSDSAVPGSGSLRDAIATSNANCTSVATNIVFAIDGTGPFTIQPQTPLPALTCAGISIDGYTQAGSFANTQDPNVTDKNDAVIQVVLDGSALQTCPTCDGLQVAGSSITVRGLAIHSFGGAGINVTASDVSIYGNYIGTDAGGQNALGNVGPGILTTGSFTSIGQQGTAADENLISNNKYGVLFQTVGSGHVSGNVIGGKRDGSTGNGNGNEGVYFQAVTGQSTVVAGNFIHYNGGAGIGTGLSSTGQLFLGNASYANTGIGIDINDDGPTLNGSPGGVQPYPVISSVVHSGGNTIITGSVQALAPIQSVQLYHNDVLDLKTEGQKVIDFIPANAVAPDGSFTRTIPALVDNVSATVVTQSCSIDCLPTFASSEYSPKVASSNPLIVTSTADSGAGSLRDAIAFANTNCPATNVITFNIPGTGIHTIVPATPLPALVCGDTVIDGYSQPGASANTLAVGDNRTILVEIDGSAAGGAANGLELGASGILVRGLLIDNFGAQAGILVNAAGASSIKIHGNILGDTNPSRAKKNGAGVRDIASDLSLAIGTSSPGDRNVISGNDIGIWLQGGSATVVQNNYVGSDATGTLARGNDTGMSITSAVNVMSVLDNVVLGNLNNGITIGATGPVVMYGNFIGTNETGAGGLGNAFSGVSAQNPLAVGNEAPGNGNVIAFNGISGVTVGATGVSIRGNSIYGNTSLGIDLAGGTPAGNGNDTCDADAGANGLQNYPLVSSAALSAGTLTLNGSFESVAGFAYTLDLYSNQATDNASNTAGRTYLGSTTVTLTSCGASWSVSFPYAGAVGDLITATATDPNGSTSWFSAATAVTPSTAPPTAPSPPIIGTATAGDAQATVTFTPPTNNGGAPLTDFTTTSSPGGIVVHSPGSPVIVTGLTNGTTYTFTVTATNAANLTSAPSSPSNAVTPAAAPTQPVVSFTPSSLAFPPRTVATTSPPQTVTVTNNGPGTLTISSISVSGDYAFTSACGTSLAPGATCTINITFTPISGGARNGTLTVVTNGAGSPHTVALTGTGQAALAAIIQVQPSSGDFAPQQAGTTSAPQLFVIDNVGNAPLVFSDISVGGTGFTLQPSLSAATTYQRCGAALQSGAVCAVEVTFTAGSVGTFTGTLHVDGNATNAPLNVPLVATSVASTPPARALSVPASVAFGNQPVGTTGTGHAVTITNNSAATVTITDLATSGDYAVSDTCTSIAAHTTCSPLVTFTPTAVGARSGTLTVRALSEATPYLVDLAGTGVVNDVAQITLSVTRVGFGNTLIGAPVTAHVILTNVGQVPVLLQSVLARAHFIATDACPFSLAPRATCDITVGFFPGSVGAQSGVIEITTNAAGSPHDIQVSGVGCAIPSVSRLRSGTPLCGS